MVDTVLTLQTATPREGGGNTGAHLTPHDEELSGRIRDPLLGGAVTEAEGDAHPHGNRI